MRADRSHRSTPAAIARGRSRARSVVAALALAALAAGVSACGGGSSGGGGGGGMMPNPACVAFAGSTAPSASTVTADDGSGSTCALAEVEIVATDVAGVFGAAFTVTFDPAVVQYVSVDTSDSHLRTGGTSLQVLDGNPPAGASEVVIGITRVASTAVDFVGSQTLCRLRFQRVGGAGTMSALGFKDERLLDVGNPNPGPIPGVTFSGGTFTVN